MRSAPSARLASCSVRREKPEMSAKNSAPHTASASACAIDVVIRSARTAVTLGTNRTISTEGARNILASSRFSGIFRPATIPLTACGCHLHGA